MYQKIITQKVLNRLLNEVDDKENKYLGFSFVQSNKKALKANTPLASTIKDVLNKNKAIIKTSEYFIAKDAYESFTTQQKLGDTGKSLGISRDGDPYTYKSLGSDKYEVVSGPIAAKIGFTFTKKSSKKEEEVESSVDFIYSIGNAGEANGVKGTKMLKKEKDNKKIIFTYLMPESLLANEIQKRIPGNPFEKVEDKSEIGEVVKEYEKLTNKKIPFDAGDSNKTKTKSKKINVDVDQIQKIFINNAREEGFTPEDTPNLLAAMMAVIDKESRWKPKGEKSYSGTSAVRTVGSDLYLNRDGSPMANPNPNSKSGFAGLSALYHLTIEQIDALKSSDKDFFDYIYGDGKARSVGGVSIPNAWTYNELPASKIAYKNKKKGGSIEGKLYKANIECKFIVKHLLDSNYYHLCATFYSIFVFIPMNDVRLSF